MYSASRSFRSNSSPPWLAERISSRIPPLLRPVFMRLISGRPSELRLMPGHTGNGSPRLADPRPRLSEGVLKLLLQPHVLHVGLDRNHFKYLGKVHL